MSLFMCSSTRNFLFVCQFLLLQHKIIYIYFFVYIFFRVCFADSQSRSTVDVRIASHRVRCEIWCSRTYLCKINSIEFPTSVCEWVFGRSQFRCHRSRKPHITSSAVYTASYMRIANSCIISNRQHQDFVFGTLTPYIPADICIKYCVIFVAHSYVVSTMMICFCFLPCCDFFFSLLFMRTSRSPVCLMPVSAIVELNQWERKKTAGTDYGNRHSLTFLHKNNHDIQYPAVFLHLFVIFVLYSNCPAKIRQ